MKDENAVVLKLATEVRELLNKHLANESRETIMLAHIAVTAFVLGCELSCTEQKDERDTIDTVIKLAREYSDSIIAVASRNLEQGD